MRRALLWAELPAVEARLRQGDMAGAKDCAPRCKHETFPELRDFDTLTLEAFNEAYGLGAGSPIEAVRWRCEEAGLSRPQALEVWRRACLAHDVIADYQCKLAEVEARARRGH